MPTSNSQLFLYTTLTSTLSFYQPNFIMRSRDPQSLRIIDLWTFRSLKSNKRYIVEVEGFEKYFLGLKVYWKGVEKSKNRYSLLTNDFEPRIIVRTCIEVMLNYYRRNDCVSFGFVAAPDLAEDIIGKRVIATNGSRRFQFYKRMMLNLFGPQTFFQAADETKTIYLMINMKQLSTGAISISDIEEKLNQTYTGDYHIE